MNDISFNRSFKLFLKLSFVLIGITLALTAVWVTSLHRNSKGNKIEVSMNPRNEADPNLGYRLSADQITSCAKIAGKKVVYKYKCSTDRFGRRITPVSNSKTRDTAFLFFNDSLVFGQGVNDNETFPFYFSEIMPSCMPYNYGCPGYGPQQMLAKLEDDKIAGEIPKSRKYVCVYLFIDSHVNRAAGAMSMVSSYGKDIPYYYLDGKGDLVRNGSFASGRPRLTSIYREIGNNAFVKVVFKDLDLPVINDKHIKLTCKMIERSRDKFKEKFGSEDFIVLFWTGAFRASKMIPYLKEAGIKYIDYSNNNTIDFNKASYSFPEDRHPTALAYKGMAEIFAKDIGRLIKENTND